MKIKWDNLCTGTLLYKEAIGLIPGGTQLLTKRPEMAIAFPKWFYKEKMPLRIKKKLKRKLGWV